MLVFSTKRSCAEQSRFSPTPSQWKASPIAGREDESSDLELALEGARQMAGRRDHRAIQLAILRRGARGLERFAYWILCASRSVLEARLRCYLFRHCLFRVRFPGGFPPHLRPLGSLSLEMDR